VSLRVRRARVEDVEQIVAFNLAMAAETEDKGLDPDVLRRGVEYLINRHEEGVYLVAETGARLVGSSMVTFEWSDWRNGRFWWIQSVYVAIESRRQGVYSALHEWIRVAALRDPQGCGIRLYVEKDNSAAQGTYHALGMKETVYDLYEEEF
jgi:ribosomal protein S18 acetylase RimI-like enzyme|tara:strand:+ start:939 stop:1391 length:453 start_codon:yes stop_codon:yes gene_type:complete